jgi:hypothetical protein
MVEAKAVDAASRRKSLGALEPSLARDVDIDKRDVDILGRLHSASLLTPRLP